jgi:ribonuclease VapC
MQRSVLDSYALLAFLQDEAGAGHVRLLLERSSAGDCTLHMSEVNYAEVKYVTIRKRGTHDWEKVARHLPSLPIRFHGVTRTLADTAANFKANNRISLADAFAAALARELEADLVTGDPEFECLKDEIAISWLE